MLTVISILINGILYNTRTFKVVCYVNRLFARIFVLTCILNLTACNSYRPPTEEQSKYFEKRAFVKAAYTESGYMMQSQVQLVAPDVQQQLQFLADEIKVAAGVEMDFRVHITNNSYVGTMSTASGDIFVPIGYLNMVANRDEIAFGLAREIAIQHRQLPLQDMEEQYLVAQNDQMKTMVFGMVTSCATQSIFHYYVTGPIHDALMKEILEEIELPVDVIYVEASGGGIKAIPNRMGSITGDLNPYSSLRTISTVTSLPITMALGWVPNMATDMSLSMMSRLIKTADEEADSARRNYKNALGLTYMQMAGYDDTSGQQVIDKLEEWWKIVEEERKKDESS